MKEQISEEFAMELLSKIFKTDLLIFENGYQRLNRLEIIQRWKADGCIKQSREEEIRERIDNLYEIYEKNFANGFPFPREFEEYVLVMTNIKNNQKEIIEILENKLKENE